MEGLTTAATVYLWVQIACGVGVGGLIVLVLLATLFGGD
jgi:uncharacterized membrane protein YhiD involved in acid resistance